MRLYSGYMKREDIAIVLSHEEQALLARELLLRPVFLPWSSRDRVAISTALVMRPIPSPLLPVPVFSIILYITVGTILQFYGY